MELKGNTMCFGCGPDNPMGLRLNFHLEGNKLVAEFTPRPEHEGWSGLTHGGIISAVLDEAIGKLYYLRGIDAVTAVIQVRYLRPVPTGTPTRIEAYQLREEGRNLFPRAVMYLPDGKIAAEAKGRFVKLGERP